MEKNKSSSVYLISVAAASMILNPSSSFAAKPPATNVNEGLGGAIEVVRMSYWQTSASTKWLESFDYACNKWHLYQAVDLTTGKNIYYTESTGFNGTQAYWGQLRENYNTSDGQVSRHVYDCTGVDPDHPTDILRDNY